MKEKKRRKEREKKKETNKERQALQQIDACLLAVDYPSTRGHLQTVRAGVQGLAYSYTETV